MKWKLNDGQFGKGFVTAKAIVAPLKELTIPRGLLNLPSMCDLESNVKLTEEA